MYFSLAVFLIYFDCNANALQNVYCENSCNVSDHVCCAYEPCGPGPKCSEHYVRYEMTDMDRKLILDLHNSLRDRVASGKDGVLSVPASNMRVMTYDKELEFIATCWASRCLISGERCMNSVRGPTSQILWQTKVKKLRRGTGRRFLVRYLMNYFMHLQSFKPDHINSFNTTDMKPEMQSLAQILWGTTKYFGCARVSFKSGVKEYLTFSIVCVYFPAGNTESELIYVAGKPCSGCPDSCNDMYKSLCGRIEYSFDDDRFVPPFKLAATVTKVNVKLLLFTVFICLCYLCKW